MLKFIRSLVPGRGNGSAPAMEAPTPAPAHVSAPGLADFAVVPHLIGAHGLVVMDWQAVSDWLEGLTDDAQRNEAWSACERAWVLHLRDHLGGAYRVDERSGTLLLSALPRSQADATLNYVNKTLQRILRILDGVADAAHAGKEILLVFDDDETYYRYAAHYYPDDPDAGEFARSSGMYISAGCGHFITVKADLHAVEPVIAHELTHACVDHLPLPAWLNEGVAVSVEQQLCPPPPAHLTGAPSPRAMHARHCAFWTVENIQEFWSGRSFLRTDDGNELSYDLARIIVSQFANDWPRFRQFLTNAQRDDAGAAAAQAALGLDLGAVVASLLERSDAIGWSPDPARWPGAPEAGGF